MPGEAAHVKLVDDRLGEGPPERQIAFPVVTAGIGDDALHRGGRVVARPARGLAVVAVGNRDGEPVWIEKDLLAIEPETTFRRERSMRAVGINLARLEARDKGMPVVIGAVAFAIERDDRAGSAAAASSNNSSSIERGVL